MKNLFLRFLITIIFILPFMAIMNIIIAPHLGTVERINPMNFNPITMSTDFDTPQMDDFPILLNILFFTIAWLIIWPFTGNKNIKT